jgi:hypothetical protein
MGAHSGDELENLPLRHVRGSNQRQNNKLEGFVKREAYFKKFQES